MKGYVKKYTLISTVIAAIWALILIFSYIKFFKVDDLIVDEMQRHARQTSQQMHEVFTWFEEYDGIFVAEGLNELKEHTSQTRIQTIDGRNFTMPLPISLAKRIESQVRMGVEARFVSNTPKNRKNIPNADENRALMSAVSTASPDFFGYIEEKGIYHYVRPLIATKSCIPCHTNVAENELIGALVVNVDPAVFTAFERQEKINMRFVVFMIGVGVTLLFYLLLVDIWRRQRGQNSSAEYAQAMVTNMSQEIELVLNNMNHLLKDFQKNDQSPEHKSMLQALKNINKDLLETSFKIRSGDNEVQYQEEIFHVEDFLNQCTQVFMPNLQEKRLELSTEIDLSVPTYILGNAYHLRQAIARLLRYCTLYTQSGGIKIRVRSAIDMPTRFRMQELQHIPIHLIIEVEDTGKGYVVTDKQSLLQNFASSVDPSKMLRTRPIISLTPINEIASLMDGVVTLIKNTNTGSCFKLVVQMKMIDDDFAHSAIKKKNKNISSDASLSQNEKRGSSFNPKSQESNFKASKTIIPDYMSELSVVKPDTILNTNKPLSIIIGNSDYTSFPDYYLKVFKSENIIAKHMRSGDEILKTLANPNHEYSVILMRNLSDMDIFYTATRIRYVETEAHQPISIVLITEEIINTDMDTLRFFNISTADNIPKDPHILTKVIRLAMYTQHDKVFQAGKFYNKTNVDEHTTKLFDARKALENAKHDKRLLNSICSIWIRFYPGQLERLNSIVSEGTHEDKLRLLRSIKNSASTVSLPMLWAEANRLENRLSKNQNVRFEKLLSIYENTYEYMKKRFAKV